MPRTRTAPGIRLRGALASACLCAGLLVHPAAAREPARIAELSESWGPTAGMVALRDGLLELGYRENQDFYVGVRFTQGDVAALDEAARELVAYGVDVIFTTGDNAASAALRATATVPIICLCNAVEIGAAQSLAHPGRNLTGVSARELELGPKRLEVFLELVPGLERIVFPYHPGDLNAAALLEPYRAGARQLGVELVEKPIATRADALSLLDIELGKADGILAPDYPVLDIPGMVNRLATRRGVPAIFAGGTFWIERGALITYGPDFRDSGRIAARLVDKILRGEDPAGVPIERNPHIRLLLNAGTAATLGLAIPQSLLLRADEIYE